MLLTRLLDDWPVANAAAAVIGPDGVHASTGDTTRRFPLASVTKVLTATAVLVAIEEGALQASDAAGPPGSTVGHLAAHASGLGPDGAVLAAPGERRIYTNAGRPDRQEIAGDRRRAVHLHQHAPHHRDA